MKKLIVLLFIIILCWAGYVLQKNNYEISSLRWSIPFMQKDILINLNQIPEEIDIPFNVRTVKLERGPWIHVLKKERLLYEKIFLVKFSNYPKTSWSSAASMNPGEVYSAAFYTDSDSEEAAMGLKVCILPANKKLRTVSNDIQKGTIIKVTGVQFQMSKHFKNGKEQNYPKNFDIKDLRIFYVTKLNIKLDRKNK